MNGRVITPTVRAPCSLAIRATIPAAPVPVPPPIPAVMKIMSAPLSVSAIASSLSSADFFPTSGIEPAPRPRVNFGPNWIFVSAPIKFNACTSVFATINSTPETPSSIIRLTAFPPAPPTPITLIMAPCIGILSNSKSIYFPPVTNLFIIFIRFNINILFTQKN